MEKIKLLRLEIEKMEGSEKASWEEIEEDLSLKISKALKPKKREVRKVSKSAQFSLKRWVFFSSPATPKIRKMTFARSLSSFRSLPSLSESFNVTKLSNENLFLLFFVLDKQDNFHHFNVPFEHGNTNFLMIKPIDKKEFGEKVRNFESEEEDFFQIELQNEMSALFKRNQVETVGFVLLNSKIEKIRKEAPSFFDIVLDELLLQIPRFCEKEDQVTKEFSLISIVGNLLSNYLLPILPVKQLIELTMRTQVLSKRSSLMELRRGMRVVTILKLAFNRMLQHVFPKIFYENKLDCEQSEIVQTMIPFLEVRNDFFITFPNLLNFSQKKRDFCSRE